MSKVGPSKEKDQDESPQIQRKTTTDQQVADQAMRRAVYSDVRKKRCSSSTRSERGSMFSKVASAIVESVRDVQSQQRVVEALKKILMADSEEDSAEELSIGEWSEVAKSLLGSLDAIFYKMSATSDPDHTKHLYKTLEKIIESVQRIDELLEKISKLSSHLENNMADARTQFAST